MRIALLIGFSKYTSPELLEDLPACEMDISLMRNVIESTKRFDKIKVINDVTGGTKIKENIAAFIKTLTNEGAGQVDELFFYYSGHGEYFDNEYFFLLPGFNGKQRMQTTIQNSELDNWIRSLRPKLTVKVVDACNSGTPYIKDTGSIQKYLQGTTGNFSDCYFLFSSRLDMQSYQDANLSYFTRSFLMAIKVYDGQDIRYKDIVDFVWDDFSRKTYQKQKPYFVLQGSLTDVFCSVTDEIRNALRAVKDDVKSDVQETSSVMTQHNKTLVDYVKEEALMYCGESEAVEVISKLEEQVESYPYCTEHFLDLYRIQYKVNKSIAEDTPRLDLLGKWLKNNANEYFAKPIEEEEEYEMPVDKFAFFPDLGRRYVVRTRKKITGIELTFSEACQQIRIIAEPIYENIVRQECNILLLISKTSIRLFYFYADYKAENWKTQVINTDFTWNTREAKIKEFDSISDIFKEIQEGFAKWVVGRIRSGYRLVGNSEVES